MSRVIEFTQRKYDNKWLCWELMDSLKKGGIGQTDTWSRYKWVITDIWDTKPWIYIRHYIEADPLYKEGTRKNGEPIYTFNL